MKIHEYQAKEIFNKYGIPIQKQAVCHTAEGAVAAYHRNNSKKVAVKAQVLIGGRGKAGGIKLANNGEEVYHHAKNILGMTIKDYVVEKILLCEAVDIASEFYISLAIDRNKRSVVLMMSASGGMEIEEVAKVSPEKILRFTIDPFIGIPDYLGRKYAFSLFKGIEHTNQLASILQKIYQIMVDKDASLVEINPLVITKENELIAVDAKIVFDDNALYRHPDLKELFEPTEDEKIENYAKEKGISYVRMEGNIGCMVNGAGLAMATMDTIKLNGGNPANFLDIGGSSNPTKVVEAMKLLLSDKKVKVVLINIFGGITRCDDVANGLLIAFQEIKTNIPIIVRLTGTNELEGRELIKQNHHFQLATTMNEATHLAIKSLK